MNSDKDGKRHTARYTREAHGTEVDARLDSRVFHRNAPPIIAMLSQYLLGRSGTVLEIGAGTGQHAAAFALAFPSLDWVPSDPFADHLASIRAWSRELRQRESTAIELDAAEDWASLSPVKALGPLAGIYVGNVTHISPWAVTEGILTGAGRCLAPDGKLFLYGPFRDGREFFGEGNQRFDAGLRADNPDWGLRDMNHIEAVARSHGLHPAARHAMPANNHLVVLVRRA